MRSRLFFVILVLLILCCALSTGLSVVRDFSTGEPEEIPPAWLETPGRLLDRRLEVEDVSAAFPGDCRQQLQQGVFVLSDEESCILIVDEASAFSSARRLTLYLEQGGPATVRVEHYSEDRLTSEEQLGGSGTTVKVFREGGAIEIGCASGEGVECRIVVVEE
jgi:hypothetical protein